MYLFANWKMYLDYDESNILANAIAAQAKKFGANVKMAVFPSALSLYPVGQVLRDVGIGVGPQNVYWVEKGGYTGEISAQIYKDAGCDYALVGHSERRHVFGETNAEVKNKVEACLKAGLTPVLCVGETKEQRAAEKHDDVIYEQLKSALTEQDAVGKQLMVAYEPVWAIGTGDNCSAVSAEHMAEKIKKWVKEFLPAIDAPVLYGGSVRPENVAEYLTQPNIGGVLVGGASAKLDSWLSITSAAGTVD